MFTLRAFACRCVVPRAGLAGCPDAGAAGNRLQVHPVPNAIRYSHHNDDDTVRVRVPGGPWQDPYGYNVKVDLDKPADVSMVYFNFDGAVEVAVRTNNGNFARVAVRPEGKGGEPVVRDGVACFTLRRPDDLSVEFDADRLHNLHVFTHAIRGDMPAVRANLSPYDIGVAATPDLTQSVLFFGPGIHQGRFRLRWHTTVYHINNVISERHKHDERRHV